MSEHRVRAEVATVWTSPDAPRPVDAAAVADVPDVGAWARSMDAATRLGLHGRTETQLLKGEPAEVVEQAGDWVRVVAPWQPSPKDDRGYPGWVRAAHLEPGEASLRPAAAIPADVDAVTAEARRFLGLRYLWGGTSPHGLDCSGLVHYVWRRAGVVVPRDASAQHLAAEPVALGDERPGDLYFFARDDGFVYHVGIVTGRLAMLHAPEESERIEDAPISPERLPGLVAAGRIRAGR